MLTSHPSEVRRPAMTRHAANQGQRATRARERWILYDASGKNRWNYERNDIDEESFLRYWPKNWDGWPMWRIGAELKRVVVASNLSLSK